MSGHSTTAAAAEVCELLLAAWRSDCAIRSANFILVERGNAAASERSYLNGSQAPNQIATPERCRELLQRNLLRAVQGFQSLIYIVH